MSSARWPLTLGLLVGLGADHPDTHRDARSRARVFVFGKALAIEGGDLGSAGIDEVGKRVGQAQLSRPDGTLLR